MRFEVLEDRRVLNSADIIGDTLVVEGDFRPNQIELRDSDADPNLLEVRFFFFAAGDPPDFTFNYSQFDKIKIDGKSAGDTIRVGEVSGPVAITILGGNGDDNIRGSPGDDTIVPGRGDDDVSAGGGKNILVGIEGDDTYRVSFTVSPLDVEPIDLLDLSGQPRAITLDLRSVERQVVDSEGNAVELGRGFENVTGTAFADSITGNDLRNRILGGNGNDTLNGLGENDQLFGGNGNDTLRGGDLNDTLEGGNNDDKLFGDEGRDTLRGGGSTEELNGGGDNDIYQLFDGGFQKLIETAGQDTLDFSFVLGDITVNLGLSSGQTQTIDAAGNRLAISGIFEFVFGSLVHRNTLTGNAAQNLLVGGSNDDVLRGGDDLDTLRGKFGQDSLFGEGGHDLLDGAEGNDTLDGGDGNDVLLDGPGNDSLDGGLDNDAYVLTPGSADTVRDARGDDFLSFSAATAGITLSLDLPAGAVQVVDALGNTIALTGRFETVAGSNFDDDITGNTAANVVLGLDGDDVLRGGAGNDELRGGDGDDNVRGQAGDDDLSGEGGNDTLNGGGHADSLRGGDDDDLLEGAGGKDVLLGDKGNDTLLGGTDDDFLQSSQGNEVVKGEAGIDTVTFLVPSPSSGVNDFVDLDFDPVAGELVINVRAASGGVPLETHRISTIEELNIDAGRGNDNIKLSALSVAELQGAGLPGVKVEGGEGNDTVRGTRGNDTINGGLGNDTLRGNDGDDAINGREGNDDLFGEDGNDTLSGEAGNDNVVGGDGDDTLLGGDDDDVLLGEEGNDTLDGGAGNNILDGGPGQDGVVFYGTSGNDIIHVRRQVGPEGPQVIFEINGQVTVDDYRNGETVFVYAGGGNDQVVMEASAGASWSAEFHGEAGHDQLTGAQRNDLLDGGEGNDLLFGLAGRDTFIGGPGLDIIFATDGEIDRIVAEGFDAVLMDGNDVVA